MPYEIIIGGALIVTAVTVLFAVFSLKLKCRIYNVVTDKIASPLTAVHISDLHESCFGTGQSKLIRAIKSASPDLILITGDMVEDDEPEALTSQMFNSENPTYKFLSALPEIAPCFMVFGNHESNIPDTDILCDGIEALGICMFHRKDSGDGDMRREICIGGEKILVCGADDPYFDRCERIKKQKTVSERLHEDKIKNYPLIDGWRDRLRFEYSDIREEKRLTLLLSHRPEEYELYDELSFDAAFSGHAHGGQWRLPPFINGVYAPHQGFFPKHAGGCYRYGGFTHIVSRGLSKKRMVRIFNRPEVCVVRFIPSGEDCGAL